MQRRELLRTGMAAALAGFAPAARAARVDIMGQLGASAQFFTLVDALTATDLGRLLRQTGPFTVFAPNEAAFARLSRSTLARLMAPEGRAQLATILGYHVVPGDVSVFRLQGRRTRLTALGNRPLLVDGSRSGLRIGAARIFEAEIAASNGLVHEIDRVLVPA